MTRYRLAMLFLLALAPALSVPGATRATSTIRVSAEDDFFEQEVVRVPIGATVNWTNEGRNPHNVIADDGAFRSPTLGSDRSFSDTFPQPGAYRYFCSFHGSKVGIGISGVILVGAAAKVPGSRFAVGPGRERPPSMPGRTIRVPQDVPTLQGAVDRAAPGDLVLVSPGVYHEAVLVTTPFLTIRGTDRNHVVLDGGFTRSNGIHVIEADGVTVENMTARHYQANGFYWSGVFGYRGSYLTAYDDGDYGVYAFGSQYGQFDHSYAGSHPDSGFYIGQCHPCHAVITDVLSENNGLGYSGTNAGGDLSIVNSEWRDNWSGIVPKHTRLREAGPPARRAHRRELCPRQRQRGGAREGHRLSVSGRRDPPGRRGPQPGGGEPGGGQLRVRHPGEPEHRPEHLGGRGERGPRQQGPAFGAGRPGIVCGRIQEELLRGQRLPHEHAAGHPDLLRMRTAAERRRRRRLRGDVGHAGAISRVQVRRLRPGGLAEDPAAAAARHAARQACPARPGDRPNGGSTTLRRASARQHQDS